MANPYIDYVFPYIAYDTPYINYDMPYFDYRRPYFGYQAARSLLIKRRHFWQPNVIAL